MKLIQRDIFMSSKFKKTLFTNWHVRRWIALIIGVFFIMQAIWHGDGVAALIGGFFLLQAVTNSGCLCSTSCGVNTSQSSIDKSEVKEVKYSEVKNENYGTSK